MYRSGDVKWKMEYGRWGCFRLRRKKRDDLHYGNTIPNLVICKEQNGPTENSIMIFLRDG
jgi:hypothetical protein